MVFCVPLSMMSIEIRSHRDRRLAKYAVLVAIPVLTAAMSIAAVVESMPDRVTTIAVVAAGLIVVALVGMAGLGALIVARAGNLIGWLFCGFGLLSGYQFWAYIRQAGPIEAWLTTSVVYFAGILAVPTLILLFPDGRLPTRRWRPVGWFGATALASAILATLFAPTVWGTDDPAPLAGIIPDFALTALNLLSTILLIPFLLAAVVAPIVRYRRAEGVQRLQFKMFGYGAVVAVIGWTLANWLGLQGVAAEIPGTIGLMALPVSITAAIMRYRLYDIDRLISRSVGYSLVVAVLALVYVTGAVWLPTRLIGEQSPLFVAVSTLAAAALFNPARRRIITWVDRRFNRTRYDAQHVIAESIEGLKDEVDIDKVAADSISVISRTMQPESVGIWIRP